MERNKAIKILLQAVKKDILAQEIGQRASEHPFNFNLQLANSTMATSDTHENWFTTLAVLCIYQREFAGMILEKAHVESGYPPFDGLAKAKLIDAIASGSKLTRADAG